MTEATGGRRYCNC